MSARQGWRGLGLPKRASKRKCSVVSGNFNLGVSLERAERMRTIRPARVMDFQSRASKLGVKITREEAEFWNQWRKYYEDRNYILVIIVLYYIMAVLSVPAICTNFIPN